MHTAAHDYVARFGTDDAIRVIDIGGRDINGTCRDLFPNAKKYVSVDLVEGPGVDVVADATTWKTRSKADVVVCAEVLEHCEDWRQLIHNMFRLVKVGGRVVITAAAPGRAPHSGVDGGRVRDDEFYENIDPDELHAELVDAGFVDVGIDVAGFDVRATGVKPGG